MQGTAGCLGFLRQTLFAGEEEHLSLVLRLFTHERSGPFME